MTSKGRVLLRLIELFWEFIEADVGSLVNPPPELLRVLAKRGFDLELEDLRKELPGLEEPPTPVQDPFADVVFIEEPEDFDWPECPVPGCDYKAPTLQGLKAHITRYNKKRWKVVREAT